MSPYEQNGYHGGSNGPSMDAPQQDQGRKRRSVPMQPAQPYQSQQPPYGMGYPPQQGGWNGPGGQAAEQQNWQGGWQQPYPPQQGSMAQTAWNGYGYEQKEQPIPQQTEPSGFMDAIGKFLLLCKQDWRMACGALTALAAVVMLIVSIASSGSGSNWNQQLIAGQANAYADRYCEGVYVDGIHLGGMTREEAQAAVQGQAQQRFDAFNIRLVTDDGSGQERLVGRITAETLNLTVDVTKALDEAWKQGHTGQTAEERVAEMNALLTENYHGASAQPNGNVTQIDVMLANLAASAYLAPANATATFDPRATNPFIITPETYGRVLETESLREEIMAKVESMESGTIEVKTTVLAPDVTSEYLKSLTSLRGSAYTLISTTSTENRNLNIIRACELINGTVIAPGESFSFNGVVGKRTAKNGFYEAIEYAYNEQRMGYGGGVCQVSSTIYISAVRAGMEITKREQHSQAVNYTTYGLDATVNYDGNIIDFKFKNNTASNIYITAKVQRDPKIDKRHDIVLISIYGEALPAGMTYDLTAGITEVIPAPEEWEFIKDKTGQYATYIDEMVEKRKASEGCYVDSYRVTYQDGVEVQREFMYRDTYPAKAQQYWVGVQERDW